jgi:thiol:disulfide interchange protein
MANSTRHSASQTCTTVFLTGILALATPLLGCKDAPVPEAPAIPAANAAQSTPPTSLARKHIYSETADPRKDIADGLKQAKREHKRVLLDFGGDWCGDCHVLDIYFHQAPNDEILAKNFVLVHIFVNSDIDNNLDLGQKYGITLKKGVPAFAVLDPDGKLLFSQKSGEAEKMSRTDAQSVTDFLNHWKS